MQTNSLLAFKSIWQFVFFAKVEVEKIKSSQHLLWQLLTVENRLSKIKPGTYLEKLGSS